MPLAEEAREIFTITTPAAWTEGRFKAWVDPQDLVAHAVALYHPRPGCQVLMFPGAFFVEWSSHFY